MLVQLGTIFIEIWIEIVIFIQGYAFENVFCKMLAMFFRPQCVNPTGNEIIFLG